MVNAIVIGFLLYRTQVVPQIISILEIVGGILVTIGNLLQFVGAIDQGGTGAALLTVVVFVFEIAFAGYMVA